MKNLSRFVILLILVAAAFYGYAFYKSNKVTNENISFLTVPENKNYYSYIMINDKDTNLSPDVINKINNNLKNLAKITYCENDKTRKESSGVEYKYLGTRNNFAIISFDSDSECGAYPSSFTIYYKMNLINGDEEVINLDDKLSNSNVDLKKYKQILKQKILELEQAKECKDVYDQFQPDLSDMYLKLDLKSLDTGVLSIDLPHAVLACSTDVDVPLSDLMINIFK